VFTYTFTAPLTILCGHYGVGKTNLALNITRELSQEGKQPTLIDLDVVNSYFRSGNYLPELKQWGARFYGPVHSADNLDTPSLMPGIDTATTGATAEAPVVLDVGGDADGARALGRYMPQIQEMVARGDAQVAYILNFSRAETTTVAEALQVFREIEGHSGLRFNSVIAATHLKQLTTAEVVEEGLALARNFCSQVALPLSCVVVPQGVEVMTGEVPVYPVDVFVKTNWE
jgi:hypothetical protein